MSLYWICTDTGVEPITYTSTGTVFVLFIAIIIYHSILKIMKLKIVQETKNKLKEQTGTNTVTADNQPNVNRVIKTNTVTYTTIELEEPLLMND